MTYKLPLVTTANILYPPLVLNIFAARFAGTIAISTSFFTASALIVEDDTTFLFTAYCFSAVDMLDARLAIDKAGAPSGATNVYLTCLTSPDGELFPSDGVLLHATSEHTPTRITAIAKIATINFLFFILFLLILPKP